MLLSEPRAGFGCDCLHVAAASPSPKCHGDPCQTGSLAESSNTFPFLVLVLLILDTASCFRPLGVITSLQSSILMGRNSLVIPFGRLLRLLKPNTSRPPHPSKHGKTEMEPRECVDFLLCCSVFCHHRFTRTCATLLRYSGETPQPSLSRVDIFSLREKFPPIGHSSIPQHPDFYPAFFCSEG
jgi:hypothetical protein